MAGTARDDEGRFVGFANDDLVIGTFPDRDPQYVDFSAADVATVHAVWRYTVTSPERVYALIRAVEYLVADELAGDIRSAVGAVTCVLVPPEPIFRERVKKGPENRISLVSG